MNAVSHHPGTPTVSRRAIIPLLRRLRSPEGTANPRPVWAALHELGDIIPAPWGGYFVVGFDACNEVLRGRKWQTTDFAWQERQSNPERWADLATREMTRTLPRLNAPAHTCQRRAVGTPFDRASVEALRPVIATLVSSLLDELEAEMRVEGHADFMRIVGEQLPARSVGEWIGIDRADHAHLLDFTHRQVYAQELLPTRTQLAVSEQATLEMREFFTRLIRERRAQPGDDALTQWIAHFDALSEGDRAAADQVIYDLTMFVTIASLETSAVLLGNTVHLATADPGRAAWLGAHPEHIPSMVEETLRYDPPIAINSRVASEDLVLAGVPVPRDTTVHVMYGAAAHDPRRNPDPDTFDPLRRGGHLSFGGGLHYCLGAGLARLEAQELLHQVLQRFPTLRAVTPPVFDDTRLVFRRLVSLDVQI
ncbi:cytochrome P450 [Streptomyces sp. NPDC004959]|uniref:cytochrome P450 n=1 Tax=unclassified Streptomyces TaxID=2593676 RepID=UPI0004CC57EA|nr:cytochrome P450 [Streptomyces sp. NRRL F-5630]